MRLLGLLSWYDERPSWLGAAVTSMAFAGCDHIIAVDGAYMGFPNGQTRSGYDEHMAILESCRGAGIGCTLYAPPDLWPDEPTKRTTCFQLAETISDESDWYFLMDGDQVITESFGLLDALENAERDFAQVTFWERDGSAFPVRCLFRAQRGLHLKNNHYTYAVNGETLCETFVGGAGNLPLDLLFVRVEHRTRDRDKTRDTAKKLYYSRRDRLGLEVAA